MTLPFSPVPDLIAAFVAQSRALPNTNALTQGRVAGRLRIQGPTDPNGWPLPCYAIVWRLVPGPAGVRMGTTPISRWNIQGECYGTDLRAADLLFRTLFAELYPDPPAAHGFRQAHCAVISLDLLGAPAPLQESETDYARVVFSMLVQFVERAV
jgi:hypothetical protein